jgi:hypothetical protein
MSVLDLSHGNAAGLNTQSPAARTISFTLDFAELYEKYPAYVDADTIKIGTLKKGMAIVCGGAQIVEPCTTASVSNCTVTDSAAKDIVLAITPGSAKRTCFAGSQATGDMFDAAAAITLLTADLDIWFCPGATVPTDGVVEVYFGVFQAFNFPV